MNLPDEWVKNAVEIASSATFGHHLDSIVENVEDGSVVYINLSSAEKTQNGYKAWFLTNFQEPKQLSPGKQYLSCLSSEEYDADNQRSRVSWMIFLSDRMGRGEVLSAISENWPWEPVTPDTVSHCVMEYMFEDSDAWWKKGDIS